MVAKIAITYGVLRRLGFSEEKVVECLEAIPGIELEEAYDWVSSLFICRNLVSIFVALFALL